MSRSLMLCAALAALLCVLDGAVAADEIDYSRDVRPILSANCFRCHGPDAGSREGGLRLDGRTDALKAGDSGKAAIVPGKPEQSELIRRIESREHDVVMPPPSSKKSLTAEQKRILKQWIATSANYQQHWAFVAPQPRELPRTQSPEWVRNPIDNFVRAKLEAAQLTPGREADPLTLLRRVAIDLVGLPPTQQEISAYLRDAGLSENATLQDIANAERARLDAAYEQAVNRLLESPQYGERWARRWLDLARYADTNGYEKDRPRTVWPYRDWVIKALNADMPFDQFTIEQLAGDMLPNASPEQRIATGFHRNTMLNEEGGIDPLEFRFHAMTDRVATTGTTWLGLTVGCAQCHSHKYDPLTHREYYQLMACLNNADEPDFDLPDERREETYRRHLAEADRLQGELAQHWPIKVEQGEDEATVRAAAIEAKFAEWLKQQRERAVEWTALRPTKATSNLPLLTLQEDDSIFASGDTSKYDIYELSFGATQGGITALRLEALPDERLPAHGPGMTYYEGTKGDFFLSEFIVSADGQPLRMRTATETYSKNRFGANPVNAKLATDGDPQTGWAVDGRLGERHVAVFVLEQPIPAAQSLTLKMTFGRHFASSLGRFRLSVTTDAREAKATELSDEITRLLRRADDALEPAERQKLRQTFLLQAAELKAPTDRIQQLRKRPGTTATLVMQERPAENPRPTFIHHRGEYLQPKDRVDAAVPAFLPRLPEGAKSDRLNFAKWLVSRENPLTARVTVNRHWSAFFGRGIVPTLQDFGVQGELPSHPELLDWLALQFMNDGWSQKRLHKLIVMSATYRQSSALTANAGAEQAQQVDPDNRLLWHAPRVRLEAEILRDSVLRAAGLLSAKVGGPSVYPPQSASITTEGTYGAMQWKASEGEDRYRRSLYTFSKRTAPFAMLTTFDAGSGEACLARRDVSNTPLQALTLLNDVMFTEASQALGKLLASEKGTTDDKLRSLFVRTLSRLPLPAELRELSAFYAAQQKRIESMQLEAGKLAGADSPEAREQALWTILARAVLNLDEFVTRS